MIRDYIFEVLEMAFNSCELCNRRNFSRVSQGIRLCESCFGQVVRLRDNNEKEISYFSNPANLMYATDGAKRYVRSFIPNYTEPHNAVLPDPNVTNRNLTISDMTSSEAGGNADSSLEISSNASSDNCKNAGNYEYEVVTVPVMEGSSISSTAVADNLKKYSEEGWKLHTILKNDIKAAPLGNTIPVNIVSQNAEIVMIFEKGR